MKTSHALGLVAASVIVTVAIEESRIAALRKAHAGVAITSSPAAEAKPGSPASSTSGSGPEAPARTRSRSEKTPAASDKPAGSKEDSFASTARKMFDNPAGKSMLSMQAKMMVSMTYQDFIGSLGLSEEESEYLKDLLGREITDQQEIGLKILGATAEERKELGEELKKRSAANEEEIKKFLNSEEDFKSFTDYKQRLPERQQLAGIQAAMNSGGASLDAATEAKLLDAMYRARTESGGTDFSNPESMEEFSKGNITDTFEKSWQAQQDFLDAEAGKFLSEQQLKAFKDYQKQMKEMQLMGIKMAEQMMPEGLIPPKEKKVDFLPNEGK